MVPVKYGFTQSNSLLGIAANLIISHGNIFTPRQNFSILSSHGQPKLCCVLSNHSIIGARSFPSRTSSSINNTRKVLTSQLRNVIKNNLSLSDILKEFNPNIKGFSVGPGNRNSNGSNFNVGTAGAIAQ